MTYEALQFFGQVYHHKFIVMKYINVIIRDLIIRAESHDDSKFSEEEFLLFVEATKEFAGHPYGSPENEAIRVKYKDVFARHYAKNRHHPEHFKDGIDEMDLVDILELLVDWKAASMREKDGSIEKSLQLGAEKYKISPQLVKILRNTVRNYKM